MADLGLGNLRNNSFIFDQPSFPKRYKEQKRFGSNSKVFFWKMCIQLCLSVSPYFPHHPLLLWRPVLHKLLANARYSLFKQIEWHRKELQIPV